LGELAPTKLIVELADRTVKHPKGIAENVLVGIDKFVFPVDFIVLDMPEDIKTPLILGRPFLSTAHAKIDVFKRKITLKPTIEEGEVVDETIMDIVKTRCDDEMIDRLDEYPSYCDFDRKIHIDYFVVVENMDSYRDEGMGDIIVGRPFCREACVKTRRFDGMITIYNGNNSVTYEMASAHDELKGISHPYQKLKGFYKGVLNLVAEYIKNDKVNEWLTRGHVSVHEIE
ncbi:lysophospholipid acyltransferase 1-like protein, partial [Tanacetum coccineum]